MSQKNHSVLIQDVPKTEEFTDVKLATLLEEKFPGAKARRFIKKEKSVLNTVKIDFPSKKDQDKTLSEGLFLNDQYFRANEYNEEQKIKIIRCYNFQVFGHVAKTCRRPPKSGKCANQHQTDDYEEGNAKKCAICQLNHAVNDPFCETFLNHASKVYKQRNIPIPSFLQTKIVSVTWNG